MKTVNNKLLTLLGFAAKAGKLSFGMDMTCASKKAGKSFLVVCANDVSDKSKKELSFHAQKKEVPLIVLTDNNIETVGKAVGRKCGILSVNDKSFAEAIKGGYANDQ